MVLYHWLNYFYSTQGYFYRYLRFLTPSFIFLTGFVISKVYLSKYTSTGSRLPKRLAGRGLRLLAMFILLNMAISLFVSDDRYNTGLKFYQMPPSNMIDIYIMGNTLVEGGKSAAFYVLVPIGYLLLLSAGLLALRGLHKYVFHVAFILLMTGVAVLASIGFESSNLEMLAIGLLGVIFGYVPLEKINKVIGHPYVLAVAYLCYIAALTVWNAIYPLQIVGVLINLTIIYLWGTRGSNSRIIRRQVILLGQYSLFGYIAQVAILQLIHRGMRHTDQGFSALSISFFAAFAFTIMIVVVVDRARAKATVVNRLYGAVFS